MSGRHVRPSREGGGSGRVSSCLLLPNADRRSRPEADAVVVPFAVDVVVGGGGRRGRGPPMPRCATTDSGEGTGRGRGRGRVRAYVFWVAFRIASGCCYLLYSTITMTAACGDFAPNGKGGYNTMMDDALQKKCKRGVMDDALQKKCKMKGGGGVWNAPLCATPDDARPSL